MDYITLPLPLQLPLPVTATRHIMQQSAVKIKTRSWENKDKAKTTPTSRCTFTFILTCALPHNRQQWQQQRKTTALHTYRYTSGKLVAMCARWWQGSKQHRTLCGIDVSDTLYDCCCLLNVLLLRVFVFVAALAGLLPVEVVFLLLLVLRSVILCHDAWLIAAQTSEQACSGGRRVRVIWLQLFPVATDNNEL